MKLSRLGNAIGGGVDNVSRTVFWVAIVSVMLVFLLVFVDVVGRYFFNWPVKGSNDIGELLLVPLAFCAISYTQIMKEHVRVTLLYSRLPPKGQAIVDAFVFFLGAVVWGLIAWNMGDRAWAMTTGTYVSSESSAILKIPYTPFVYVAAVGSTLFCLQLLADSMRIITRRSKPASSQA